MKEHIQPAQKYKTIFMILARIGMVGGAIITFYSVVFAMYVSMWYVGHQKKETHSLMLTMIYGVIATSVSLFSFIFLTNRKYIRLRPFFFWCVMFSYTAIALFLIHCATFFMNL
jgi:hypothetical protein